MLLDVLSLGLSDILCSKNGAVLVRIYWSLYLRYYFGRSSFYLHLNWGANRMNFFQNSIEDIVINIFLQELLHSWNTKCLIVPMKEHQVAWMLQGLWCVRVMKLKDLVDLQNANNLEVLNEYVTCLTKKQVVHENEFFLAQNNKLTW